MNVWQTHFTALKFTRGFSERNQEGQETCVCVRSHTHTHTPNRGHFWPKKTKHNSWLLLLPVTDGGPLLLYTRDDDLIAGSFPSALALKMLLLFCAGQCPGSEETWFKVDRE